MLPFEKLKYLVAVCQNNKPVKSCESNVLCECLLVSMIEK